MVIASRLLKVRSPRGDTEVCVRLFIPEELVTGNWSCRYEIDWPHGQRVHAAQGLDSIQAVFLAMQMIGAEIYASEYHRSAALFFDRPGGGYGFPVASSLRDLLIGDDAKFL
jgi:hypothetical protein